MKTTSKAILLLTICLFQATFIKSAYPNNPPDCVFDFTNSIIDSSYIDTYYYNGTTPGPDFFWCEAVYNNFIDTNGICQLDSNWCRKNVSYQGDAPDDKQVVTSWNLSTNSDSTPNPGYTNSIPNIYVCGVENNYDKCIATPRGSRRNLLTGEIIFPDGYVPEKLDETLYSVQRKKIMTSHLLEIKTFKLEKETKKDIEEHKDRVIEIELLIQDKVKQFYDEQDNYVELVKLEIKLGKRPELKDPRERRYLDSYNQHRRRLNQEKETTGLRFLNQK